MKFISLKQLFKLFDLADNSNIHSLIALINQNKQNNIQFKGIILFEDNWKEIVKSLENPKAELFYEWIETDKKLKDLIENGKIEKEFSDHFQHFKHAFSEEYKSFLSPYLYHQIINFLSNEGLHKSKNACSYILAMNGDYKVILESTISKMLNEKLDHSIELAKKIDIEEQLIQLIQPLCSDEIVNILNFLSKESYATKLKFVDDILKVIHFKACTTRFANWLINQLLKLKLNNEHQLKIESISRDLHKGKIQTKNQFETSLGKFSIKKSLILVSVLVVALFFILVFFKKPLESKPIQLETTQSAYQQFTIEERKEIDSILKTIDQNKTKEYEQEDAIYGASATLFSQHQFKNERMSKLYQDLLLDADLVNRGQIIPLKSYSKNLQKSTFYPGVSKLNNSKKEQKVSFSNESEYDLLIFCIDNNPGGKIYSRIVNPEEKITFEMFLYDEFIFIPGGNFGPFVAPQVPKDELPSSNFKHHFTQVDFNYIDGIQQVYRMNTLMDNTLEIRAIGDKGEVLEIESSGGLLAL